MPSAIPAQDFLRHDICIHCRSYLFYMSKFYELLDTVLLVLKKVSTVSNLPSPPAFNKFCMIDTYYRS